MNVNDEDGLEDDSDGIAPLLDAQPRPPVPRKRQPKVPPAGENPAG